MLQTVCYFIVYMAEAFIAWQYMDYIFLPKYRDRIAVALFLAGYCGMFFLSNIDTLWVNSISFFGINLWLFHTLYFVGWKEACFHAAILTVVMSLSELLLIAVFQGAFEAFRFFDDSLPVLIMIAILCKFLYYILALILARIFGKRIGAEGEAGVVGVVLSIATGILMWITLTLVFICGSVKVPQKMEWMIEVSALLVLAMNIMIFWLYTYQKETNYEFFNMQLQMLEEKATEEQYEILLKHREAQNILIHDIKKYLGTIAGLLENGKEQEAVDFVKSLLQLPEFKQVGNVCSNPVLNVILSRYIELCQERQITLNLDVRKGSVDVLNAEELSALFGNLLDNAVEAAEGGADASIDLNVESREGRSVIMMINSCREAPKQLDDGKFVSRKKDKENHGYGMKSIEQVVKAHGGNINAYYDTEDTLFHTVIVLGKKYK